MRVCMLDLESSDLWANTGVILLGHIKPLGEESISIRGDQFPTWERERASDRFVAAYLRDELTKYNLIVAHNGVDFDIKFLNTRLIINGLDPIPPKMIVDPCLVARNKLRMKSNRLDMIISALGLENLKTAVDPYIWNLAVMNGDRQAMDTIDDHCRRDVIVLEQVYERLLPLVTQVTTWGSAR